MNDLRKRLYAVLRLVIVSFCVYFILKYLLPIFLPFVIAYALYRMLKPILDFFSKKLRIPDIVTAVFILGLGTFGFIILNMYLARYILRQASDIINNGSNMIHMFHEFVFNICEYTGNIFECNPLNVYSLLSNGTAIISDYFYPRLMEFISSSGVILIKIMFFSVVVIIVSILATVLLIKNWKQIDIQIQKSTFAADIFEISSKIWHVVSCFVKTQVIIIFVVSIVCCVGLFCADIKYFIVIGIVIGILDALPVIGSGTVLIPWAVISFLQRSYKTGIILLILYGICSLLREFLEARLMGSQLGINEFYMLMATFVGISLFGFSGIILGPLGLILILEIMRMLSTYLNMRNEK